MKDAMVCGGGIDAADMVTVSFFDWDDTFLGARAVPVGGRLLGDHNSPDQRGDGIDRAPLPPEYNLLWDANGNGTYDFVGINSLENDTANKMGYVFAGWVDFETGHSTPEFPFGAATGQTIPTEELVGLDSITESRRLKAAYNENPALIGETNNKRSYLISHTPFVLLNGELHTNITIRRAQNTRRASDGKVALRVVMQVNGSGQFRFAPILFGKKDVETIDYQIPVGASGTLNKDAALTFSGIDMATKMGNTLSVSVPAAELVDHSGT